MNFPSATWRAAIIGRWIARIVGTLFALFFLAFLLAEGPPPVFRLTFQQNLTFVGMLALFLGLLAAWRWEAAGSAVALAGYLLLNFIEPRFFHSLIFSVPATITALHILCWLRIRSGSPAESGWDIPARFLAAAGSVVGIFILLAANEIFGSPPLMTAALRPGPDLVGTWTIRGPSTNQLVLTIHDDGTTDGTLADTPILSGRIRNNRTWFGNLMHWRAEYLLNARTSQPVDMNGARFDGPFRAAIDRHGEFLQGDFFDLPSHRGFTVTLVRRP